MSEYESLVETLEILNDPRAVADLRKAEGEYDRGEGSSLEDLNRLMAERHAREQHGRR
ncbi:MAG TPA: hypothetical protein VGR21_07775 [Cryptosporangiaceae bacterium]|nr:hypothetical protein [Cryptosporangiaceae bacterium]